MNTSATTPWFAPTRALTLALVRHLSVTNTPGERAFAPFLHGLLMQHPYFQAHPRQVWTEPVAGDPLDRSNVFALVRGQGNETLLLTGHYDVVSVASYGRLIAWASEPEALLPRLIAELTAEARGEAGRQALADLESGDWLPGRGALDMKSGLAAGISVLYRWAETGRLAGNLLFIATPDEEEMSRGVRAAVARLPDLAQVWGLELVGAINLDATTDPGDGQAGQAVFLGSVGKLLPSVYIVGRETHAGAPFDGVNAARLAAAVTQRVECNPALADWAEGEAAPPPVCLRQTDDKEHYDVTTPRVAWACYNLLNHRRTPAEVLDQMVAVIRDALDQALAELAGHAQVYARRTGQHPPMRAETAPVITFAALKQRALERAGPAVTEALDRLVAQRQDDTGVDTPQFCYEITRLLWNLSGLTGPAAVVGLASLTYPTVYLAGTTTRQARLRQAVGQVVVDLARDLDMPIRTRPFLPGISDMSFLGGQAGLADQAVVAANTPAWGPRLWFDAQAAVRLNLPIINIGPWGRDYHHRLERVYLPYACGVVPELIWRVAQAVFQN